jgi:hypothetical protein
MVFRVIDAMDLPHEGRLIRIRLQEGKPKPLRQIRGGRFLAKSPEGLEEVVTVRAFAMIGGRPSDSRFERTGRLDLIVTLEENGDRPSVSTTWEIAGPV